jgi:hypothetical protein
VSGGTIYDVYSVIHNFYQVYKATNYDMNDPDESAEMDMDRETGTYSMGDGIWFEGLTCVHPPQVWMLTLGS